MREEESLFLAWSLGRRRVTHISASLSSPGAPPSLFWCSASFSLSFHFYTFNWQCHGHALWNNIIRCHCIRSVPKWAIFVSGRESVFIDVSQLMVLLLSGLSPLPMPRPSSLSLSQRAACAVHQICAHVSLEFCVCSDTLVFFSFLQMHTNLDLTFFFISPTFHLAPQNTSAKIWQKSKILLIYYTTWFDSLHKTKAVYFCQDKKPYHPGFSMYCNRHLRLHFTRLQNNNFLRISPLKIIFL